jgi:prepilin-type N-terminal cleavage/methylation domain-containing protein
MKKRLTAFSLVEMLMTIAILSIVMLIATQTLNTVFKVSTISRYKTVTRNEMSFALELVERLLANSNVVDVYIYDSTEVRAYDEENDEIDNVNLNGQEVLEQEVELVYNGDLDTGDVGNEIHFRPYGYSLWVCIGYFRDANLDDPENPDKGYLIKRTVDELSNHASCFSTDPTASFGGFSVDDEPLMVLTSEDVQVNDFAVSYIKSSDINNVFHVDLTMEPTSWVPGESDLIKKTVTRQATITTQGLTWY